MRGVGIFQEGQKGKTHWAKQILIFQSIGKWLEISTNIALIGPKKWVTLTYSLETMAKFSAFILCNIFHFHGGLTNSS